jgi:hypothetical protein
MTMFKCLEAAEGFEENKYLFKRGTKKYKELFEYMDKFARKNGWYYDERITDANSDTAALLHDAIMNGLDESAEVLAAAFVQESRVGMLHNIYHPVPIKTKDVAFLFNDPSLLLILEDTPYRKADADAIEIEWELEAPATLVPKDDMPAKYERDRDDEEADEDDNMF